MVVQLLLCKMLLPGFIQYDLLHSCANPFKFFLYTLSQHPCGASI